MKRHLQGQRHLLMKAKVASLRLEPNKFLFSKSQYHFVNNNKLIRVNGLLLFCFRCELCNISASSAVVLAAHLTGKNHLRRMNEAAGMVQPEGQEDATS
jgi:Zinc-finger of C2H2 type